MFGCLFSVPGSVRHDVPSSLIPPLVLNLVTFSNGYCFLTVEGDISMAIAFLLTYIKYNVYTFTGNHSIM